MDLDPDVVFADEPLSGSGNDESEPYSCSEYDCNLGKDCTGCHSYSLWKKKVMYARECESTTVEGEEKTPVEEGVVDQPPPPPMERNEVGAEELKGEALIGGDDLKGEALIAGDELKVDVAQGSSESPSTSAI